MKKRHLLIIISLFILIFLSLSINSITSFLLARGFESKEVTIGNVRAIGRIYYEEEGNLLPANEVVIEPHNNITKEGIYFINLEDEDAFDYIDNIKVYIFIYSDVETYVRVKLLEQLTFIAYDGIEYTIPKSNPIFEINSYNWYKDNDWLYYRFKEKHKNTKTPTIIELPLTYNIDEFKDGYHLQLGIKVQAVQAIKGPQENWGFYEKPWGGEW